MNSEQQLNDLTWKHQPFPELVRLTWPIVTSLFSYSLMTLVDALFVGRLGAAAIAATGLGGTAVFGVLCFGMGLLSGAKVRVSEAVGAGARASLLPMLGAFLRVALLLGLIFVALGQLVALALPSVSGDPHAGFLAQRYCALRSLGMPLALVVCAIAQYRQALGDSQSAMRAALLANLLHIPLNFLLIFGCDLGVQGAATASVLCTGFEAYVLWRAQRSDGFGWRQSNWAHARRVFAFGLPSAVERWLDSAAFVALVVLIAQAGPQQLAAHQITLQMLHFCFLPMVALSDAVCVLVAQANGAREPAVARRVVAYAIWAALGFGLLCAGLLASLGPLALTLFTSDAVVLGAAWQVVKVAVVLEFINCVFMVCKGALRGVGELRYVALVSVACAWVFTPPLTWLFTYRLGWGAAGGWLALSCEVLVATVLVARKLLRLQGGRALWQQVRWPWRNVSSTALRASQPPLAAVHGK